MPTVDSHNKSRQHHLALEKCWLTKSCWGRLFISLIGMSVVDLYRAYRFEYNSEFKDVSIVQFADIMCNGLVERKRKVQPRALREECNAGRLKRIRDRNGNETKTITNKQKNGKHSRVNCGSAVQKSCWICRSHGKEKQNLTSFCCVLCNTPICSATKTHPCPIEFKSCLQERLCSRNPIVQCDGYSAKPNLTPSLKKQLMR